MKYFNLDLNDFDRNKFQNLIPKKNMNHISRTIFNQLLAEHEEHQKHQLLSLIYRKIIWPCMIHVHSPFVNFNDQIMGGKPEWEKVKKIEKKRIAVFSVN